MKESLQQNTIISCRGVWKTFQRSPGRQLLRQRVGSWFRRDPRDEFQVLKDISFEVSHKEGLAIIGRNGAGKSTLLSLLAGLAPPDRGSIQVNGRIAALLELGSGMHPDLTGAENIYLNAALLGFGEKETRELFDPIVEFSGVRDFIDQPLRTFSSGMHLRLAFAIAVNVDPDILIVDEVLAVGDVEFQAKCYERIRGLRAAGKSFICVSHARPVLEELCDQAIWLDHGELVMTGKTAEVLDAYEGRVPA